MNSANTSTQYIQVPKTLNLASISDLSQQLDSIDKKTTKIIILKGNSEFFCTGLDIRWVVNHENEHKKTINLFNIFLQNLNSTPCITLASVEGKVQGGGLGITAACDITIASSNSSFQLTEGLIGLIPGLILPWLLERFNKQTIKKLVFTAEKLSAESAYKLNFIDETCAQNNFKELLDSWIKKLMYCKKQSIFQLKQALKASNNTHHKNLKNDGRRSLIKILGDPLTKETLTNIAYAMDEI